MPHRIAGIDVHKKMLAVVASDVRYRASDISKPSARLLIDSVVSFGRSFTKEFVTKNVAQLSAKGRSNSALRE
jgi:hypothetical protein